MMKEDRKPIQGRIVEMEHLIARNLGVSSLGVSSLGASSLANLQTPRPGLLAAVPPAERVPREQMLKIGASYYDALVNSDGDAALSPAGERHADYRQPSAEDSGIRDNGRDGLPRPTVHPRHELYQED